MRNEEFLQGKKSVIPMEGVIVRLDRWNESPGVGRDEIYLSFTRDSKLYSGDKKHEHVSTKDVERVVDHMKKALKKAGYELSEPTYHGGRNELVIEIGDTPRGADLGGIYDDVKKIAEGTKLYLKQFKAHVAKAEMEAERIFGSAREVK